VRNLIRDGKLAAFRAGEVDYYSDLFKALDAMNHAMDDVCVATGRPQDYFSVKANTALSGRST
jgi:hypothetical protein